MSLLLLCFVLSPDPLDSLQRSPDSLGGLSGKGWKGGGRKERMVKGRRGKEGQRREGDREGYPSPPKYKSWLVRRSKLVIQ